MNDPSTGVLYDIRDQMAAMNQNLAEILQVLNQIKENQE